MAILEFNWDEPNLLIGENNNTLFFGASSLNKKITKKHLIATIGTMPLGVAVDYGISLNSPEAIDAETFKFIYMAARTYTAHSLWLAVKWLDLEDEILPFIKAEKMEGFEFLGDFTIAIHKLAQAVYIWDSLNEHQLGITLDPLIWTLRIEFIFCQAQLCNSGLLGKPNLISKKEIEERRRKDINQLEELPGKCVVDDIITTIELQDLNHYQALQYSAFWIAEKDPRFLVKWQDFCRATKRYFTMARKSSLKHIYLLEGKYFVQGQGQRRKDKQNRLSNLKNKNIPLRRLIQDSQNL